MKLPEPPLLLITDRKQARLPLPEIAEAAFEAGCRWISVREKDLSAAELAKLVAEICRRAENFSVKVSVHGSAETARESSTGVHLASGDDACHARSVLGAEALIGISIHSIEEARRLNPQLVDYAIAGAVFETGSKTGYRPLGLDAFRKITEASPVPVVAIGGIGPSNCRSVIRAGAEGVAVMGGVMRAADPGGEIQALIAALRAAG